MCCLVRWIQLTAAGSARRTHPTHNNETKLMKSIKANWRIYESIWFLWFPLLSVSMISSIKYISPALLFNKSFLKSYQYLLSLLYLIQSVWLYVDLVINKFLNSLVSICWFHNDCLLVHCSYNSKSCSVIMLFIIAVISTYIIIYSFN